MKHVHADLIIQCANDTSLEVECLPPNAYIREDEKTWEITRNPSWCPHFQYRVKNKWQHLIDALAADPTLVIECSSPEGWDTVFGEPKWFPDHLYRIKPKA